MPGGSSREKVTRSPQKKTPLLPGAGFWINCADCCIQPPDPAYPNSLVEKRRARSFALAKSINFAKVKS
jgi:hypothetical protein